MLVLLVQFLWPYSFSSFFKTRLTRFAKQNLAILLCIACLYCLNRFWLKEAIIQPVIHYVLKSHFNDFLAGIAISAYLNLVLSLSKYRRKVILTLPRVIIFTLLCALLWEYILPLIFPHGVSDYYDVIAYVLGGIIYITLIHVLKHFNMKKGVNRCRKMSA